MKIIIIDEGFDIFSEFSHEKFMSGIERALDIVAGSIKLDFEELVSDWKHQPSFEISTAPLERTIFTTNENFARVNYGTRGPYPIVPRKPDGVLRIEGKYIKTRAEPPYAISQKVSGGEIFYARKITHPGIGARNFVTFMAFSYKGLYEEGIVERIIQRVINGEDVAIQSTGVVSKYNFKNK